MSGVLSLEVADRIVDAALVAAREQGYPPMAVVVLDAGGHVLVAKRDERAAIGRVEIAMGKAHGCLAMGFGGRELARRAEAVPQFFTAIGALLPHGMVPVAGGVLIRDSSAGVVGSVGISGGTSDEDDVCAVAGIHAAGLVPDTGDPPPSSTPATNDPTTATGDPPPSSTPAINDPTTATGGSTTSSSAEKPPRSST
ncbi:GlcG/HbpS family heme-binding protein [Candidatus Poriferisocius sp.]|uniref:GlcG/HbpS family heme-binding protein n=1 Tax=Candidatus Poriferisocius sp. TaxID=3101276 RepID=UPI003B5AB760